jgi:hypothetical protein
MNSRRLMRPSQVEGMQLSTLNRRCCASQQICLRDFRKGSLADIASRPRHVRFTRDSGHQSDIAPCPLCADFVVEVGDDRCVATGANFVK